MSAAAMVEKVQALAAGLSWDVISIGYPGPVAHGRIVHDPANLGDGWTGFDFAAAFGCPVRLLNDALMQAIGSYDGGRMLFLGLGTGLGAAMIVDYVAQPLELAHLPYRKGRSYEDYVGEAGLKKHGRKKWEKHVADVIDRLAHAMEPDYLVIGGGNADKLESLPDRCRLGDNANAFTGGVRAWTDDRYQL
jgi:polyphosphate glucokinase